MNNDSQGTTRDNTTLPQEHLGVAGKTARAFIRSPLSPLFFVAMLIMGAIGLVATPRQEDPQISVPMVDIMVSYPGASSEQVSKLALQPLARIMSEIPGVKHVYSAAGRNQGIVTVEFDVGEEMTPSLVKVNDKLASNMDKMPPGVMPPLVKSKGIDDVPVVTLTLWSRDADGDGIPDLDDAELRLLAQDLLQELKAVKNTGSAFVVGGLKDQITVDVDPETLSGKSISLDQVAQTIKSANKEVNAGSVESGGYHFSVATGSFLASAEDIANLIVGSEQGVPIYVRDIADVRRGPPEDAKQRVEYFTGPAHKLGLEGGDGRPAVTIAIAKKELTNGVKVAQAIIDKLDQLVAERVPSQVEVSITRNYGETADHKVTDLIKKLFIATGFVFLLVWAAFRALRPALVVMLVIPVVLLMTIFVAWVTDYTIDRVSLFALIFSIGILVDDAIVVIENIYRRWLEEGRTDEATAVDAVREVGNPTILATFTVIAALLPMGFVSGMMGPYMEPIPALGSVAMFISLFAAFVFTPYLAISPLFKPSMRYLETAEKREHREAEGLEKLYRGILTPLIESKGKRAIFRLVLWGTFIFTLAFFYWKWVPVKMLPLDNKPEFSVVLDMPEGTALINTLNLARDMAEQIRHEIPEVTAIQLYAGTARPFDFNGMVRHYYLRSDPWQGELQVELLNKKKRHRTSHEIAVETRQMLNGMLQERGSRAKIAVVEMPPGPPVLQSVVAEIHHENPEIRRQFARDMTEIFQTAESARDVDNYLRQPYEYYRFEVDAQKAKRRNISVEAINRNLMMALGGASIGDIKQDKPTYEPVNIVVQVPLSKRSRIERLYDLPIQSDAGYTVPLSELGAFRPWEEENIIYTKDLRPVEYVVADVGGNLAAPVYAMNQIERFVKENGYTAPDGVAPSSYWLGPPPNDFVASWEWTGEWTVTYETFRDMGTAFAAALVLIYVLVVWEFGNFRIPLVIMAPIPLTLLGIIPAHGLMFALGLGGEFTATSMIGWIALAGIIVRNSILLVDFSIHELQKGVPVAEAVIRACKTRTRPILITALALVCGSSVIFFDPIFQGMAISLASGVLVSTVLTLVVIPLGCVAASKSLCEVAVATAPPGVVVPCAAEEGIDRASAEGAGPAGMAAAARVRDEEPGMLRRLLVGLGEALSLLFYAVRGILLLLFTWLKGKLERKRNDTAAKPTSTTSGSAATSSGGTTPPETGSGSAAHAKPAAEAEQATVAAVAGDKAPKEALPKPIENADLTDAASTPPADPNLASKADATSTTPEPSATPADSVEAAEQPVSSSATEHEVQVDKAEATAERRDSPSDSPGPVENDSETNEAVEDSADTDVRTTRVKEDTGMIASSPSPSDKPKAQPRKSGRRGIRLKVDEH